jgi:formiminoglutamase
MNFNDYFNPVSLDKPDIKIIAENLSFSRLLNIHTPDNPIRDIEKYDLAIVGVPEDKSADIKGSSLAPDQVRSKLYQLSSINRKTKVIDLGNLKITHNINDTYYALRDITTELRKKNVVPVIIGGSQDISYGIAMAFAKMRKSFTFGTIDSRVDYAKGKTISSSNYLEAILKGKKSASFNYFNLGNQSYFTHAKIIDYFEKRGYDCIRLGAARNDLLMVEPYLRDAGFLSIDMSAVRQSEAPGVANASPNGFFSHELCQLARYTGIGSNIEGIGVFELCPDKDVNFQTAHLAAQVIWYFIEGFSLKMHETGDKPGNKKYHIDMDEIGQPMIFYQSLRTERWWMELPFVDEASGKNVIIACTHADYLKACNNEIPDRWWKACHRFE